MLYNNIIELIGNTPILRIAPEVHKLKNIDIYAKLEFYNPFGSVKDRVAYGMIKDDIKNIKENNQTIIESSSGNTAKALQVLAAINGIEFKTVTNRIKIPEVKSILQMLGAEIEELPGLSECPDPTDPNDPVIYIEKIMSQEANQYFHTAQYVNMKNRDTHYDTTGKEIYKDVGSVDYFFGTLGTTGSSRGIIEYLYEKNENMKKVGIVADKGDTIPGIRNIDEMYEVGIYEKKLYDHIITVDSIEAIDGMLKLIKQCGVLGGPTSGGAFWGTLKYLQEIDEGLSEKKKAVFVVCDRVEWYVSYIQKRRPDLFDATIKKETIRNLSQEELSNATTIKIQEALEWVEKNNSLIIDLRGGLAFKTSHIPNSINIVDDYFEALLDSGMPFANNMTVLLVCPVGEKSKKFVALMKKRGFEAYSLEGGMVAWRDAGYPMERSRQKKKG
ncbi:Pyridoxal-5'-phosphate-dependent protein, beta subunit [Alkaliphilus metalliredigens QYMF]|uniref:Pyridoxal-5'-phosphate-dependent protein, beta subunit n=1 Tax=Alkaliphilus metalliredigens (strain QYMF) TaxID=293826 RepID=A6TNQ8_ALKMQ|nr:pyridoxal-phosphate dependent enzyme [Alkaliphilus metalliredigens]ABR47826.1 Pyridoxal-5'-phosphate-dependent protein, beta subunit [Alkaliphilus metalliredigens QYMF]